MSTFWQSRLIFVQRFHVLDAGMIAVVVNGEVAKRFRYGWTARKVCSELDKQFGRGSLESEDLFAVDPDGEEVLEAGEYVYKIQAAGER